MVAVMAVFAAGSVRLGHDMERRAAEQELLAVGGKWSAALTSWRRAGGIGPEELSDLLRGPRVPGGAQASSEDVLRSDGRAG